VSEFEGFGQEMVCFFKNGGIGFVGENSLLYLNIVKINVLP